MRSDVPRTSNFPDFLSLEDFRDIFMVSGKYLILLPDENFTIAWASEDYLGVTHTKLNDIVGKGLFEAFPPDPSDPASQDNVNKIVQSLRRVIGTRRPDSIGLLKYAIRVPTEEGVDFKSKYWIPINKPVPSDKGEIRFIVHGIEDATDYVGSTGLSALTPEVQAMQVELFNKIREISETRERLRTESEERGRLQDELVAERRATELAAEFRKKLEEFIASFSHELRNPLAVQLMGSELLTDKLTELNSRLDSIANEDIKRQCKALLAEAKQLLETIILGAQHQRIILDDVLDLAKLEHGDLELHLHVVDIISVISSALEMYRSQIEAKGVKLILDIPREPLWLKADFTRLIQVISNLLSNANKFTSKGQISFTAKVESRSEQETALHIIVEDTGIGMTQEQKDRLFRRFEQASHRTAMEYGGSGLGLAISKQLIEKMGGSLSASSRGEWQGSKFEFVVNLANPSLEEKARAEEEYARKMQEKHASVVHTHPIRKKRQVLIAEDVELNQRIFKRLLETLECECDIAENGVQAVIKTLFNDYDVIFMDITMPLLNGIEATIEIRRALTKHVPIIACTGNTSDADLRKALEAGMDAYLLKPYKREEICSCLDRFCPTAAPEIATLIGGSASAASASNDQANEASLGARASQELVFSAERLPFSQSLFSSSITPQHEARAGCAASAPTTRH